MGRCFYIAIVVSFVLVFWLSAVGLGRSVGLDMCRILDRIGIPTSFM